MAKEKITQEFLTELPKTDLHVHLDGSIRIPTLIDLAKEYNVDLPSYTEDGLRDLVFKERYPSLQDYLQGFGYTVGVMQTEIALERVSYEFAVDNHNEGVRYFEVRFAPQLHMHEHMTAVMVLRAVNRGLERARDEANSKEAIKSGKEPPFAYGIIVCAMRMFMPGFSEYFTTLMKGHRHAPQKEIFAMASLELARAAIVARDEYALPIVGFDLAGEEAGYPAADHHEAYAHVHKNFMKKTVHAGEAYGPESIFQAITELHADRIGHGTYLLEPGAIRDPAIKDPEEYVERLGRYIADRRITLEICLTSNMQTNPQLEDMSQHSLTLMRDLKLSTTICTDNRTVSNTTMTRELKIAVDDIGFTRRDLKSSVIYGFKRSFYPDTYSNKRAYIRDIIDYYEKIERKHFGETSHSEEDDKVVKA